MSELISGKEALIALANGGDVEWKCKGFSGENWHSVLSSPHTKISAVEILKCEYGNDDDGYYDGVLFRRKPHTITINGIEVSAPFKPDIGDIHFYLNLGRPELYARKRFDGNYCDNSAMALGAWRTEEEIKQVVAALRSIFNAN